MAGTYNVKWVTQATRVFVHIVHLLLLTALVSAGLVFAEDEAAVEEEMNAALALKPNLEDGKVVYEVCISCHTEKAWGTQDGEFPQLAGQHRSVIIKQITDIRIGNRDNPTMVPFAQKAFYQHAQGLSDVAGYLASLPVNPNHGKGPGTDLQRGAELYRKNCAKCHGDDAMGDDGALFPRLQGQNYAYLVRQLKWIREGKRKNVYPGMIRKTRKMTIEEFEVVSDYISHLPTPEYQNKPLPVD